MAEIVYSKHPVTETWTLHTPTVGGALGHQQFTLSALSTPTLPPTASQAMVSIQGVRCRVLKVGIQTPLLPPPPPASIEERIAGLPPELKCAMDFLSSPDGFEIIALAIAEGRCYAVSDGSLKDQCGTAAFTLVTLDDHGRINVVLTVPGPIPDRNSYRCELTGIYGIMVLVKVICQHYHITTGSVHVCCDNKSALLVLEPWFVPEPSHDSFDIVNAIWHLLQESPISWTGEWVKAHQDDDGVLVTERFAVLNCEMDVERTLKTRDTGV
jgi:hypothetical protein